jgi:hypothetical protein
VIPASRLRNTLVPAPGSMASTVGEEPVDDYAEDGEEEDDDAPEHLVQGWAVGLEHLH